MVARDVVLYFIVTMLSFILTMQSLLMIRLKYLAFSCLYLPSRLLLLLSHPGAVVASYFRVVRSRLSFEPSLRNPA